MTVVTAAEGFRDAGTKTDFQWGNRETSVWPRGEQSRSEWAQERRREESGRGKKKPTWFRGVARRDLTNGAAPREGEW